MAVCCVGCWIVLLTRDTGRLVTKQLLKKLYLYLCNIKEYIGEAEEMRPLI